MWLHVLWSVLPLGVWVQLCAGSARALGSGVVQQCAGLGCGPWRVSVLICPCTATSGKKQTAKSKEELAQEKKKELEKRLQDVSGQLNSKKPAKKGTPGGPVPSFWRAAVRRGAVGSATDCALRWGTQP